MNKMSHKVWIKNNMEIKKSGVESKKKKKNGDKISC